MKILHLAMLSVFLHTKYYIQYLKMQKRLALIFPHNQQSILQLTCNFTVNKKISQTSVSNFALKFNGNKFI